MRNPQGAQMSGRVLERDTARQLVAGMVGARVAVFAQLERIGLIRAGEKRPPFLAPAKSEVELDRPARQGFVEVDNPQAGVVNAAELDQRISRRPASWLEWPAVAAQPRQRRRPHQTFWIQYPYCPG